MWPLPVGWRQNWHLLMLMKAASTICFGWIKTLSKRKIRHNNNCNTPKVNPGLTSLLPLQVPDSNLTLSVLYSSLEKNKWRADYRVAEVGTFNSPLPRWKLHLIILSHCWSERNIRWGNWLLSTTWNGQQPAWWLRFLDGNTFWALLQLSLNELKRWAGR